MTTTSNEVLAECAAALAFWGAEADAYTWTLIPACPYCGQPHRHEGLPGAEPWGAACARFPQPGRHTYTVKLINFTSWAAAMGVDERVLRCEVLEYPLRPVRALDRAFRQQRGTALLALAKLVA